MVVATELHDRGVDLDRVDVLGALRQGHRHVVAGARTDDEHVVTRPGIRVGVEVERRVAADVGDRQRGLERGVVDLDAEEPAGGWVVWIL